MSQMLNLLTGQPGNGKTLLALSRIEALRKKEGCAVFVSGIPLSPDGPLHGVWQELGDIAKRVETYLDTDDNTTKHRYTLPPGSIVLIDEAQRTGLFPTRSQGKDVPAHVKALETGRHTGVRFYLLTQHPHLIDMHVRKLANYHIHLVRRSGLDKTNVYEWEQCESDPMSERAKKTARHSTWSFPSEVYTWYTSAEKHVVKRNLPLKQIAAVVLAGLVVLGSVAYVVRHVATGGGVVSSHNSAEVAGAAGESREARRDVNNPWDADFRAPRVVGWERTAAVYDELQEARSQPKVAGCLKLEVGSAVTCRCHTSQGSVLPIDRHECARLIRDGWFDETLVERSAKQQNIDQLNARDAAGASGASESEPAAPAS